MKPSRIPDARRASITLRLLSLVIALGTLGAVAASAQTWEYAYGSGIADGKKRVTPVLECPGGGYIAVGTINLGTGNDLDLYVVHVANNGTRVWEYSYDVTALGWDDDGWAIAEVDLGRGYVITGSTVDPSTNLPDGFIMKIDCDGNFLWANTYGQPGISENAHDIIITTTGNPAAGTSSEDLVVAGWVNDPLTPMRRDDAWLFRTDRNGLLLWDARYNNGDGYAEAFYGVTEMTPLAPATTGDLFAVGGENAPFLQGYVVRVNGDNGAIGVAPQGASVLGISAQPQVEFLYACIEQQNRNANHPVNGRKSVVAVGEFNNRNEIYAVRFIGGNPCGQVVEQAIGIPDEADFGTDIIEINSQNMSAYQTNLQQWDLVVCGFHRDPAVTADLGNATLLALDPFINPVPARLGREYSANRINSREQPWSLQAVYPVSTAQTFGIVMCGFLDTRNPFTSDMYLVKTDGFGNTPCLTAPYNPVATAQTTRVCRTPDIIDVRNRVDRSSLREEEVRELYLCAGTKGAMTMGTEDMMNVSLAPNPIIAGRPLTLAIGSTDDDAVSVTVTNSVGVILSAFDNVSPDASGNLNVPTVGMLPGAYNVTVRSGSERVTIRFVVVE